MRLQQATQKRSARRSALERLVLYKDPNIALPVPNFIAHRAHTRGPACTPPADALANPVMLPQMHPRGPEEPKFLLLKEERLRRHRSAATVFEATGKLRSWRRLPASCGRSRISEVHAPTHGLAAWAGCAYDCEIELSLVIPALLSLPREASSACLTLTDTQDICHRSSNFEGRASRS